MVENNEIHTRLPPWSQAKSPAEEIYLFVAPGESDWLLLLSLDPTKPFLTFFYADCFDLINGLKHLAMQLHQLGAGLPEELIGLR